MSKIGLTGSDPEFFIENKDGEIVSSIGIVGGSKDLPKKVNDLCSVHEDNVTMEIAIKPAKDEDEFTFNLLEAIRIAEENVGHKVSRKSSHVFADDALSCMKAREAGCGADFDAKTGEENPRADYGSTNLRCCGGHVHIDLPTNFVGVPVVQRNVILFMDIYAGVPSVILDGDTERRKVYGKASCYRETKYGVEYRTLSNFWCFDEKLIRFIYQATERAVTKGTSGEVSEELSNEAIEIINSHDVARAIEFCERNEIPYINK